MLKGIDLDVRPGDLLAILGASGSGKTTLLRLIGGFERPDSGTIEIDNRVVDEPHTHLSPEKRRIGYVAQEGALFPHLSVADNIVFGLSRRERRQHARVEELLALVGLPRSFAGRPPQALSGGEQQRVALARALAPSPQLVLLDEPFSALDAALRAETRAAVVKALSDARATALLVTHDQAEALSAGDQVAVLQGGTLAQVADPVTLYRRPQSADLARFVGDAVLLPGVAKNGRASCALGDLPLAPGAPEGKVEVLVRPEQVKLQSLERGGVCARVRSVTFYGHDASVALLLYQSDHTQEVVARVAGHAAPYADEELAVFVEGYVVAFQRHDPQGRI
ncbi:MAG: ABC transporter ATP-binding protein [Pseudolabrys sp.]